MKLDTDVWLTRDIDLFIFLRLKRSLQKKYVVDGKEFNTKKIMISYDRLKNFRITPHQLDFTHS